MPDTAPAIQPTQALETHALRKTGQPHETGEEQQHGEHDRQEGAPGISMQQGAGQTARRTHHPEAPEQTPIDVPAHHPEAKGGRGEVRHGDSGDGQLGAHLQVEKRRQHAADAKAAHRRDGAGQNRRRSYQHQEPGFVGEHHLAGVACSSPVLRHSTFISAVFPASTWICRRSCTPLSACRSHTEYLPGGMRSILNLPRASETANQGCGTT
jgi:hypothetical protein